MDPVIVNQILSTFATIGMMVVLIGCGWVGYTLWQIAKGLGNSAKILTAIQAVAAELKAQNSTLKAIHAKLGDMEYSIDKLIELQYGSEEEQVADTEAKNE